MPQFTHVPPSDKRSALLDYTRRVADGEGFMPWQERDHVSQEEVEFRAMIEERKTRLLASRSPVSRPVMLTPAQVAQAKEHAAREPWAQRMMQNWREVADYVAERDDAYITDMIPELTPSNPYGVTCPNCVGRLSQECSIYYSGGTEWDYRNPQVIRCKACGQVLPDARFPEEGRLVCPRSGQVFTYFINHAEKAYPDDRSGTHAWKWAGFPIHVSFEGIVRERKVLFMIEALSSLGLMYAFTGEPRYASRAVAILTRFAHCYRRWLYHDYADSYLDCDPMYGAWHHNAPGLPIEWVRNACSGAFLDVREGRDMVRSYFGSGRIHPSCDVVTYLVDICRTYDLVHDVRDGRGRPLWSDAARSAVERDFLLEYIMGAEYWLGGHLQATNLNNKAGRAYCAVAAIGVCLGLPGYVDTALRGYEALLDKAFLPDGHSSESPFYSFDGFLGPLILVPQLLDGFRWPASFKQRTGSVAVFKSDLKLRQVFTTLLDTLMPDGRYVPFSDTRVPHGPGRHLLEIARKHYPDLYRGKLKAIAKGTPTFFALCNLTASELAEDEPFAPRETLFPHWKAAVLRHGSGPQAACLAVPFNNWGIHIQNDSLNLFYADGGHTLLGDQGYMCDTPMNAWIFSTFSHNLVIVDDAEQGSGPRTPSLRLMLTSPFVSVVEVESNTYAQCSDYRRFLALIKGPGSRTLTLDIFRVAGGGKHTWRCFSEIGSSDQPGNARQFQHIDLAPDPPLPNFGGSVEREHVFGLRDPRAALNPPAYWTATWSQQDRAYRLHMLTDAHAVQASHGPGQEDEPQVGRRVRYLDVTRQGGSNLQSTFIALHEPSLSDGSMPVRSIRRITLPPDAGPDALAIDIDSHWGRYLFLLDFQRTTEVEHARFQGKFGLLHTAPDGRRTLLASGSSCFVSKGMGFNHAPANWAGRITGVSPDHPQTFLTDTPRPSGWPEHLPPPDITSYARVGDGSVFTGFPVKATDDRRITLDRYPLAATQTYFDLPATWFEIS